MRKLFRTNTQIVVIGCVKCGHGGGKESKNPNSLKCHMRMAAKEKLLMFLLGKDDEIGSILVNNKGEYYTGWPICSRTRLC